MKRKNATRSALFTSIISLLLCVSMLVGTTFAWFTDSVVSGVNTIAAGNLDVELYHGKTADPTEKVDNTDKLFTDFENNLIEWWEPGVVAYTNLKVANVGTLALKYQMALNFSNATAVEHEGETYTLADVLKVAVVEGGFTGDRAAAHALDYTYTLSSFELQDELKGNETTETYGIVVYWEPGNDDYDNIFNLNNGKTNTEGGKTLSIDLGVNLFASQLEYEEDSFDINYDKDAAIFVSTAAELQAAINNVQNNGTICLNDGTYDISGQLTVPGKSVNFVGVGENVVINMTDTRTNYNKIFYIYGSATEGEDVTVNISNVTLTAAVPCKSDIWVRTDTSTAKVKGNVTVNLDNVNCATVICDNNYVDGDTVNLNVYDSAIGKVTLDASPFNGNGLNTYTNLTYKDSRIDHINIQPGAASALDHITINGVKPSATGEQQAYTYASSAAELQAVLDAAGVGDHYIVLFADIEGDVIVSQKEGVNIVIDGANYKYDGTIYIDGKARYTGAETLAIKNINFVTDKDGVDFISANIAKQYAHNVTIEDCTFTNNGTGTVVPARFRQAYDITIKDCTVDGTFSPLWTTGVRGLIIENVTANCANEGITIGASDDVLIEDCTITVPGAESFGIRTDATAGYTLTVNNCTLNVATPIVIRGSSDTYTVTVDGAVQKSASNQTELAAAVASGNKVNVTLSAGTYTLPSAVAGKEVTISGSEDTVIDVTSGLSYATGADVTFEGVTIQSEPEGAGYTNGFADCKYATFNNCVIDGTIGLDFSCEFNNCEFNIEGNYYNVWTWGAGTATFNGCTFNCDGKAMLVYANVLDNGTTHQTVNITNCVFNDNGDDTVTGKAAIEITNTYNPIRTYDVIINNTTVNGFSQTVPGAGDFNAAYGSVAGSNIGTNVWGNKCKLPNTQINVVIDGVDVY